ncbi:UDP-N-acetylmuramoyl-tripeptide--D-alanyl-D-alanine ligase [Enterococcus faecalis]
MKLTLWEAAQAVEATNDWHKWPDRLFTGVEFDSRLVQTGNLFVPLQGMTDGHTFTTNAVEKGAAAAFWSIDASKAPQDLPILQVPDTLQALQKLAVYYLKKVQPDVIAITGSNGKTTTKDLVAAVLAEAFQTYKTQGNYNNQIGLPYTILQMPDSTEKLVLEMGMDHAGEISFLSQLAQPKVAAITMIGEAHLENLGSRAGIAKAKMEITAGLASDGCLLVPGNEPLLTPLLQHVTQHVETFGLNQDCQLQGFVKQTSKEQTSFTVSGSDEVFTIPVPGTYNVSNALIAVGIGRYFGVEDQQIKKGLIHSQLTQNRTQWLTAANGAELLSDVYNANPTAMSLVLDNFSQMPTAGKRIAILGDMLELGPESAALHQQMAAHLDPAQIMIVFLYGEEMNNLKTALQAKYAPQHLFHFAKTAKKELMQKLVETIQPEDLVVLKASNGMGLKEVIDYLMKEREVS